MRLDWYSKLAICWVAQEPQNPAVTAETHLEAVEEELLRATHEACCRLEQNEPGLALKEFTSYFATAAKRLAGALFREKALEPAHPTLSVPYPFIGEPDQSMGAFLGSQAVRIPLDLHRTEQAVSVNIGGRILSLRIFPHATLESRRASLLSKFLEALRDDRRDLHRGPAALKNQVDLSSLLDTLNLFQKGLKYDETAARLSLIDLVSSHGLKVVLQALVSRPHDGREVDPGDGLSLEEVYSLAAHLPDVLPAAETQAILKSFERLRPNSLRQNRRRAQAAIEKSTA